MANLEDEMFQEVLAYGLRLLEMQHSEATAAERDGLAALVRHECCALVSQASWRRKTRYKRLQAPDPGLSGSRDAHLHPAPVAGTGGGQRLTKEMFDQFCRCTGLGSEVLVGKGENLATLVFYIAVHAVISSCRLATREEILRLLRAASECGNRLQRAISKWLEAEPPPRPALTAEGGVR
jgi:hypothetical protein